MSDEDLRALIRLVMEESPVLVASVKNGKTGQGFLVGRTIMKMPAAARKEPSRVLALLQEELARP